MCLIIHNPEAKTVNPQLIDSAIWQNPDGFGIFFHDTKAIEKTMREDHIEGLLNSGRPYTCHFRYATSGPIGRKNCHPFRIDATWSLMMNGSIERLGSKRKVDTAALCEILDGLTLDKMLAVLRSYPCRFALCNRVTGEVEIVNRDLWKMTGGVLVSNGRCDPEPKWKGGGYYASAKGTAVLTPEDKQWWLEQEVAPEPPALHDRRFADMTDEEWAEWEAEDNGELGEEEYAAELEAAANYEAARIHEYEPEEEPVSGRTTTLLAVYGTLKSGYSNNHLLSGSEFVGDGLTVRPYEMVDRGIPFVFAPNGSETKAMRIHVEVWRVPVEDMPVIDGLEGHPNWYRRERVPVTLDDGATCDAWMYLMPEGTHTARRKAGEATINKYIQQPYTVGPIKRKP